MPQTRLDGTKILKKKSVEYPLEEAENIAKDVVSQLEKYSERIDIVGSIRRRKSIVHDIDLVVVAKPHFFNSGVLKIPNVRINRRGKKIIEVEYRGIQIDINLANNETYETLKLIKTGSEQHNIMLCTKAKKKGWHLYASGHGLYDGVRKIADTENEILQLILGKVPRPEERE